MQASFKIFLIDDDEDDREIFKLALETMHIHVDCRAAKDGGNALDIVKSEPDYRPDFIFLDLNMPKMNGWECLDALKQLPHISEIPVYIYTTSCNPKDEADLLNAGAAGFIKKPHYVSDLALILNSLFKSISNSLANN